MAPTLAKQTLSLHRKQENSSIAQTRRQRAGQVPCALPLRSGTTSLHIFPTLLLLLLLGALFPLIACGPVRGGKTNSNHSSTIGSFAEYALPQAKSGIMRPTADHQGRIWFGEMGNNALAVFDPHTQTFQQMSPPDSAHGIMGISVAADNTVWFAEQYANYIGHYFPASKRFQTYSLPTLAIPDPSNKGSMLSLPSGPNDVTLDAQSNVWFTEMNADSIAMLDTKTGNIRQYPLTAQKTIQKYSPYGITRDPQGTIWFSEANTNQLGHLDPNTGVIQTFTLPGANNPLMEVASDAQGTIWATTFDTATLLKFDPASAMFTAYNSGQGNSGLYGLAVTPQNGVWVTMTAANKLAQFDTTKHRFNYYTIPTTGSLPLGITQGTDKTLWFTESASDKIGVLKP